MNCHRYAGRLGALVLAAGVISLTGGCSNDDPADQAGRPVVLAPADAPTTAEVDSVVRGTFDAVGRAYSSGDPGPLDRTTTAACGLCAGWKHMTKLLAQKEVRFRPDEVATLVRSVSDVRADSGRAHAVAAVSEPPLPSDGKGGPPARIDRTYQISLVRDGGSWRIDGVAEPGSAK
ncbi:hypothetical protein [Amycolatopsis anabasis]|uniref:hypothetical protein n=1 Tax=Amycolatopsis anabasis TaxID=1840409 RepID=UPI00131EC5E5|nr:hypothetical protein [Amycolatopsis anabasis]